MTRNYTINGMKNMTTEKEEDEYCTCGHSVYAHGFFEGNPRAGDEEFINGCTDCDNCREYKRTGMTLSYTAGPNKLMSWDNEAMEWTDTYRSEPQTIGCMECGFTIVLDQGRFTIVLDQGTRFDEACEHLRIMNGLCPDCGHSIKEHGGKIGGLCMHEDDDFCTCGDYIDRT